MDGKAISRDERREQIRQRVQDSNLDERQLVVIPAEENISLTDETKEKRVCAYCRVSTDDPAQTTSYELQKKHYKEQIESTPGWIFAGIYADEGISATSLKNRDEFNRMIEDCYAGKIDAIVTKNVSRFARNVVDCVSIVRKLAQLNPPVGVKFENEGFFSLDNTSEMILTVLAAAAQEESKTKSNSMNWSLEKRFDNGNFLTPVLLGYDHDEDGNLIVNPEEALTVRLMFYTYLAGFTLSEVADLLMELKRPTKKGNLKWTTSSVRAIMQNERYCGNVLSWKTYTYDFWEHKKRKNNKNRKQVLEIDHHEGIVSHEIFDAVQAKLQYDQCARKHLPFPTLDVIDGGALLGYVSVNRTWKGFTGEDYIGASESVYEKGETDQGIGPPGRESGLDDFEIARTQFFSSKGCMIMSINGNRLSFNTSCMKKFETVEYVELLINTVSKCIVIRPCSEDNPNAIRWGKRKEDRWIASPRSISGFAGALFSIMGWNPEDRYNFYGEYYSEGEDQFLLFNLEEPETIRLVETEEIQMVQSPDETDIDSAGEDSTEDMIEIETIHIVRKERIFPKEWDGHFGVRFRDRNGRYFERIRYQDNWEILRPAKTYMIAAGVSETILREVETEAVKMIEEMRYAV